MFDASAGCGLVSAVATAAKTNVAFVSAVGFYIHHCSSLIVWSPAFLFALWSHAFLLSVLLINSVDSWQVSGVEWKGDNTLASLQI